MRDLSRDERAQALSDRFHDGVADTSPRLLKEGELGLREAIEARYRQLTALLEERLGLEPSKETRMLYLLLGQT